MATAKKLPSGKWRVQVYLTTEGKPIRKSFTADTKREAEYMAAEFVMNERLQTAPATMTLGTATDRYIESKRQILAPSTIHGYELIRNYRFPDLMLLPISKITDKILQTAIYAEMKRTDTRSGKPPTPKTIKNAYGLVSAVLREYRPGETFRVSLPKIPRKIRTLPEPDQIYEAVKGTNIELPVLLAMWLSLTESEIRGLSKSESIDGDYLTVRSVVVHVGSIDVRKEIGKTDTRNRRLKIPPHIKGLIEDTPTDTLVPQRPCVLYRRFQKCLEDAGLSRISFHDLRHVNATIMASLRIPDNYAIARGGWKTDHIMKTVYTETFDSGREKADRIIDEHLETLFGLDSRE